MAITRAESPSDRRRSWIQKTRRKGKGPLFWPTTTANIPLPTPSPRSPSSIPLQSLQPQSSSPSGHSTKVLESASEKGRRRSSLSHSVRSEFSNWTETGDLAEQLADAEGHPLQVHRRRSLDREAPERAGSSVRVNRQKHTHYLHRPSSSEAEFAKTSIEIPRPPPRRISRIERTLAVIMSPSSRQTAQMHGLVGKPLL